MSLPLFHSPSPPFSLTSTYRYGEYASEERKDVGAAHQTAPCESCCSPRSAEGMREDSKREECGKPQIYSDPSGKDC